MQATDPMPEPVAVQEASDALELLVGRELRLQISSAGVASEHPRLSLEAIERGLDFLHPPHARVLQFRETHLEVVIDLARVSARKWSYAVHPSLTLEFGPGRLVLTDLSDDGRIRAIEETIGRTLSADVAAQHRDWKLRASLRTVDDALGQIASEDGRNRLDGLRRFLAPYESARRPPDWPTAEDVPL